MNAPSFLAVLQTKTGQAGVVAIVAGLLEGFLTGDWAGAIDKFILGAAMLTGRHAILKQGA